MQKLECESDRSGTAEANASHVRDGTVDVGALIAPKRLVHEVLFVEPSAFCFFAIQSLLHIFWGTHCRTTTNSENPRENPKKPTLVVSKYPQF
jgi:hypothetical protein